MTVLGKLEIFSLYIILVPCILPEKVFVFVCLFVYSRMSNSSTIWRLSPLPVTGLQIYGYARHSGPLSREGSLSCHTYCDTGPRFIRSHLKDRPPRPKVGFEPPTQGSSDLCTRCSNHCAKWATLPEKVKLSMTLSRAIKAYR
jgi:hypothetical protein